VSEEIGVIVATEQRFLAHKGTIFANAIGGNEFWQRYLEVFSWVRVIARVQHVDTLPEAAIPIIDKRIRFALLPNYQGPIGIVRKLPILWPQTKMISQDDAAFILRVPSMIGSFLYRHLQARRWPYAVEVVGDPYDSLSLRAIGHTWARIVRPMAVRGLQRQCQHAVAATYVTKTALQHRYPPNADFVTHYSDVELSNDLVQQVQTNKMAGRQTSDKKITRIPRIIFVGSLSQRYKGLHILLQALKACRLQNIVLNLEVLGDGIYRSYYELMVFQLGLDEVVVFRGYVKQGKEVFNLLYNADLFVMPSLVEGLPRAMIEAMACGLPCIGSRIGGIPELLSVEDMVPPGDAQALAKAIIAMLNNPDRMELTGQRNREVAMEYASDVLRSRRQRFYDYVRDITLKQLHLRSHQS